MLLLGTWEGAVEGVVDFSRQDIRRGGSKRTSFEATGTEERLTLRNAGAYIYDPRLVTLSVGGTFGLSQERFTTDSSATSSEGTVWGYDAFASILSEKAYSLNLFANRNHSFFSRELAGRSEVRTESRGATLFARRLYIPSTLTFRQEVQEGESRTGDIVTRRKDQRNVLAYQGQRGWIDSEMDLRYEFIDQSNETFPNLSYQNHDGRLNYSLDFGPELNWRWDSRMHFLSRSGVRDLTTLTVDESLGVDHTEWLRTESRYFLTHTDTLGTATTTHTGAFNLNLRHQLYESLTTTFGANASFRSVPEGWTQTFGGQWGLAYTKRLPWEGRLTAGLRGGLQYAENRFRDTESFVPQESVTFDMPFALPIALRNAFVAPSSVVVTKVALGPLPVGCIAPPEPPTPLILDRDYTLRTVGDITQIVPIPCAGAIPGINPGDTIAVDYRFAVSPSLTFTTTTWHADVSLDYRWIRAYFAHDQTEQSLLSGRDGRFLDNPQSDTLGTELRYDERHLRASLVGEAQRFRSRRQASDTVRSNQFLAFTVLPELTLTLSAGQAFVDFPDEHRQTRTLSGRASLTYRLNADLSADALGGIRWVSDTLSPTERTLETSLRVRWLIRRLEVNPTLEFFDRRRGDSDTQEYRATLHVIRRF